MPLATVAARFITLHAIHSGFTSRCTISIHMMTRSHVFAVSTRLFTFCTIRFIPTFYKEQIILRGTHTNALVIFDRYVKPCIFLKFLCAILIYSFSNLFHFIYYFLFVFVLLFPLQNRSVAMSHVYVIPIKHNIDMDHC